MENKKKYYWLKLQDDFFERDEIKLIESMPEGKEYIVFYFKLLLKSVSTEGKLLFRGVIPYTPEMLSGITNTNIATVKYALDIFTKLGLMECLDDGSLWMSELEKMIGSETEFAKKKREYREKLKAEEALKKIEIKPTSEKSEDILRTKKDNVRQEFRDKSLDNIKQQQSKSENPKEDVAVVPLENISKKNWEDYNPEEQKKALALVSTNAKNKVAVALTILRKGLPKDEPIQEVDLEKSRNVVNGRYAFYRTYIQEGFYPANEVVKLFMDNTKAHHDKIPELIAELCEKLRSEVVGG